MKVEQYYSLNQLNWALKESRKLGDVTSRRLIVLIQEYSTPIYNCTFIA